jgi:hypothetical protein
MKHLYIYLLLFVFSTHLLVSQNNALILHDAVHVNIEGGAILVVAQTHEDGIVTSGTGSGVINSEGETNRVAWIINSGTGDYVIPFGINSGERFPMTYHITGAGSASGALTASTYPTDWDNLPWPAVFPPAVTNTGAQYINGLFEERRHYTLDRYWVLRDLGMAWGTPPSSHITFTYRDVEHTQGSNTINETNLAAQYWDTNQWRPGWHDIAYSGVPSLGTVNTAANAVSAVNAATLGNLYTWVLVDQSNPLPIELIYLGISCADNGVFIEWASASETNNDYYTIQRSMDGINWQTVTHVSGAGNSNQSLYYSYLDVEGLEQNFIYRLLQTDYDGNQEFLGVKDANCAPYSSDQLSGLDVNLYSDFENNIYITYFSESDQANIISIYDINGKLIGQWHLQAVSGMNHFKLPVQAVAQSVYLVTLIHQQGMASKKILLR